MDLEKALTLAHTFIVTRLNGDWPTIAPLSAAYEDDENDNWIVKCEFKRKGSTATKIVTLWINDDEEEVISFNIE